MLLCSVMQIAEKLVYLHHSLKDGTEKVIEGLSQSGDHCAEVIMCLKSRYDHDSQAQSIRLMSRRLLKFPPLKDLERSSVSERLECS